MMKAAPTAALVVIRAERLLEVLIVALNAPLCPGEERDTHFSKEAAELQLSDGAAWPAKRG